jgi:hypothetical protein
LGNNQKSRKIETSSNFRLRKLSLRRIVARPLFRQKRKDLHECA